MIRKIRINDKTLIIFIIAAGAILRFWRLPDIPFTHDEFSAIIRAQFNTFHELIEHGVKIDGHPAGVQVFIYYLIKIFGVSESVLKTPFILFGLGSVFMVYVIGKKWYNSTVGLVSAAFLSFLQYPVMYSQIARPYASGLLLSLLLVYFWTNVIFNSNRKSFLNLAGFAITAAMCAYDHHFAMLFAVMVGVTGLFYTTKATRTKYLAACGVALILYIPHLSILFHQLSIGGVEGWLQKPEFHFLPDYLKYVFHFSIFVYLLVMVIIILSIIWYQKAPPMNRRYILISFIWFLLPFLIGFFYSKYRSAVLQNSVLLFSFPYLLFLLFGFFKTVSVKHQIILVSLIGIVLIPSLIFERRHYTIFYNNPYREMVVESKKAIDTLGSRNCVVVFDTKKEIAPYYLNKDQFKGIGFIYFEDIGGDRNFLKFMDSVPENYLIFGCLSATAWENYALIHEKFPWLVSHKKYNGGDFYIFSKTRPEKPMTEYFSETVNTFESVPPEWNYFTDKHYSDSLPIAGKKSFQSDSISIYSPTYSNGLWDMIRSRDDVIDVSVDLQLPQIFPGAWLISTITSGEKTVYYHASSVSDFINPGEKGRIFGSVRLSDVSFRDPDLKFTTYLWNPRKTIYKMDNFRVSVRSGNPVIYGLYRKISVADRTRKP